MKTTKKLLKTLFRPLKRAGLFVVSGFRFLLTPFYRFAVYLHHTYIRLAWRHPIMNRLWFQVVSGVLIVSFIVSPVSMLLTTYFTNSRYNLSASATALVGKTTVDTKLIKETDTAFTYNRADEASPKVPEQVLIAAGKKTDATGKKPYQAEFGKDPRKGVTFSDSAGDRSLTLTPQFGTLEARMTDDRVMYPNGANEKHVYSLKTNGIKSDIILNEAPKETTKTYSWDLTLSSNVEAKLLPNGGVGIYSADNNLFNVQTDNKNDQDLLNKARTNGQKNTLAFELPAPFILDQTNQQNYQDAKYTLENNVLTLTVKNLDKHSYPLTIDPTITVTTTADFNQLTGDTGNIDTSTDGQIQRATSTTGAVGTNNNNATGFTTARQGHTSVVYNGYLYIVGGSEVGYLNDIQYCPLNSNGSVGSCTQQTNAFTTARQGHTSVVYNGYLYIIGGYNNSYQNDIQRCPLNSNGSVGSCTQQTNAFTTGRYGHTSLVYNGYLYIVGGMTGSYQNDIQYCPINSDGTVGSCTQQTNAFTTARQAHTSVVYNGFLYIVGGIDFGYQNDIQYCPLNSNGSVGTCTQQTSAFTTGRYGHTSVVYNGYLYIIGGEGSGIAQNDIQYCPLNSNGSVGTCTQQTSAFTTVRYYHSSVVYNGYIYVIGGMDDLDNLQSSIKYVRTGSLVSPMTQQTSAFTTARAYHSSVVYNGYLYIIGGTNNLSTGMNDIQRCPLSGNGSVGTCTQQTSAFTTARYAHTSVVYNGYLYIVGGWTGSSTLNDVIYCPFNSNGSVGTCTQQTNKLNRTKDGHTSVVYNGYLYVAGGNDGAMLDDIEYCPINSNGSVGTCTQQTGAFTGARNSHASVVYNGYFYILGGYDGSGSYYDDIQYCPLNSNGSVGTCTRQTTAFTTARDGLSAVVNGGYLYIIGGNNFGTRQNDIQYCPLNSNGSVGTCTQKTSAFTTARDGHTSVLFNGYIYIVGGTNGSTYYNDIQRMQVGASNAGFGTGGVQIPFSSTITSASSVTNNGYLYLIGGYDDFAGSYANSIEYCPLNSNGSVGTCTLQTSAFTQVRGGLTSVVYKGYLYIIGGTYGIGQYLSDIQYCPLNSNGSVGTCTQQTNAFTTARYDHTSIVYNGYLYIVGGWNGTTHYNDIQYCPLNSNGSVGTCTQQTNAFTTARYDHTSIVYNGYLYVIGGRNGSTYYNDIQYCPLNSNGSVGTCTTQNSAFMTARSGHASVVYNGYLYIIGGYDGTNYYNDIQYCPLNSNGSVGTCTTQNSAFTTARSGHTSVVYNGYLYIMVGTHAAFDFACGAIESTDCQDLQYNPLKTITDTARYERFFDTGSAANVLTSLQLQGTAACMYTVTYKTAGSNGVWGSATTIRNVATGVAQSLGVTQRYIFVTAVLDDSTCGGTSTITSMSLLYNVVPDAPTLILPAASATGVSTTPEFRLGTTEGDSDYLRYKIEVCSTSNCSSVVRTIDQTSSQTGWTSQSLQSGTAYAGGASITQLAIHQYQPTELSGNTQYWWRAQAIDPAGTNTWSAYSSIGTFTTGQAAASRPTVTFKGSMNIGGDVILKP